MFEARKFGITKAAFAHAIPDKDGTLDRKEAAKAGIKSKKVFDQANPDKDHTLDLAENLDALTVKAKQAPSGRSASIPLSAGVPRRPSRCR
jgi:hypothetical protein